MEEMTPIDFSHLDEAERAHLEAVESANQARNPIIRGIYRAKAWFQQGEVFHQTEEHEGMVDELARLEALNQETQGNIQ